MSSVGTLMVTAVFFAVSTVSPLVEVGVLSIVTFDTVVSMFVVSPFVTTLSGTVVTVASLFALSTLVSVTTFVVDGEEEELLFPPVRGAILTVTL